MRTLDERLESKVKDLEVKYQVKLTKDEKENVKDGIIVGYSKDLTFENAEKVLESRIKTMAKGK